MDLNFDFKKMSPKEKKQAIIAIVLLPITIIVFAIAIIRDDPDDSPSPPKTEQTVKSNNQKNKKVVENKKDGEQDTAKANTSAFALSFGKLEIASVNPFIEISNLVKEKKEADKANNPTTTRTPAPVPAITRNRSSAPRSVPLPAIPARNSNVSANAPQQTPSVATVQGVLTGEDGHNMAIMSDGKVVSEGDIYGDGRIAFIGGDGIQFDNGQTMKYK